MNATLIERATGSLSASAFARRITTDLLLALQPAPRVHFDGSGAAPRQHDSRADGAACAHTAGTNALAIDPFEGRYMISGSADSGLSLWDLEDAAHGASHDELNYTPLRSKPREASAHTFGITHLSFYPFDPMAFLSSSYDHTLKLYSSETLVPSASFDLDSVVYSHAMSPIASHLLVACATQHPAVRLIDLRSGASTHSLIGHAGAVLSVNWSPLDANILATGGADGTVRFWDVRRSSGALGVLDMDDSIGVVGSDGLGTGARRPERGRAHAGPVNGVVWTEDAQHLVTCGHDEQVRVWDTSSGANTLANFGPTIRNPHLSTLLPLVAPKSLVFAGRDVIFYPNEREILVYELFEGKLTKRLRAQGLAINRHQGGGQKLNPKPRTTALAWRAHAVELLSAHGDGIIRSWRPRTTLDDQLDEEERLELAGNSHEDESRKRKRQILDDIYRDLTTQKITFT